MAKSKLSYEDVRKQRMEANKKRMEELNLKALSLNFQRKVSKPAPAKPRVSQLPGEIIPVRRSTRFAGRPSLSYAEVPIKPLRSPRRGYSHRKDLLNRVYASNEARQYAIDRANELQAELEPGKPSFVKPMLQSHVTGGFWLGLPFRFCKDHLPDSDKTITLEDEAGDESEVKYLSRKKGLSAGWRGFAIDHELVDGDAVVFQLTSPVKFKVYIIRANESEDNEED